MRIEIIDSTVPDDMICPITHAIMDDPVLASDGHSYERSAIGNVIKQAPISPLTRERLESFVFTNRALHERIKKFKEDAESRGKKRKRCDNERA